MEHIERQPNLSRLSQFNIRAYGLLIYNGSLLVIDELFQRQKPITKLPGGALELGEGLKDCLEREFEEETGLQINVGDHFYTTDFFQQSLVDEVDQMISVYYMISHADPENIPVQMHSHAFDERLPESNLNLRWLPLVELTPMHMSLPIDKVVITKLLEQRDKWLKVAS